MKIPEHRFAAADLAWDFLEMLGIKGSGIESGWLTDRPYFNYKMPKGILSSFELIPSAINSSAPSVAVDYARLLLLHLLRKSFLAIRQDTHAHVIPT